MPGVLSRIRYLVIEALYEAESSSHAPEEAYNRRIETIAGEDPEAAADGPAGWGRGILRRVWAEREELDELIGEAAPRYPVETLAVIDRNILRLAIWELRSDAGAPVPAVINEAVELAHRYGGERSPAFIHGVLGTVSRQLRPPNATGRAKD